MHELDRDKAKLISDPQNLNVIFKEMIQMCLWYVAGPGMLLDSFNAAYRGNATVQRSMHH